MPVHDWAKVDAGIFHDLHVGWVGQLRTALNDGLLPDGYYALAEQHAGKPIAGVLTLHAGIASPPGARFGPTPEPSDGGTAVAEAPPRVRHQRTVVPSAASLRRSIALRHVSGHRLIALIEILSPANKDRPDSIDAFCDKVAAALNAGVSVLFVDLFPPGPHDPRGMHGALLDRLAVALEPDEDEPTSGEPLMLVSYAGPPPIDLYVERAAPGASLPDMPLFLDRRHYVNVPLDATYQLAYRGMPAYWRDVLESRRTHPV